MYASAPALGLTLADDLDALLLRDNGNGTYEPSIVPLDWLGGQTDMLLFSVTRDSPLVGAFDAIHGVPIMETDILTVTPGGPGILVFGEALGLWTLRAGLGSPSGYSDNLDALSAGSCFPMD